MAETTTAYFDWCPRSTYSIGPRTYRDKGDKKQFDALKQYADSRNLSTKLFEDVLGVFFAYRTDGFFAFGIEWKNNPKQQTEYNVASVISQYVKTKLGHVHFYNQSNSSDVRLGGWRPHHKYPVKLSPPGNNEIFTPEALETLLADETKLVQLSTVSYPFYEENEFGDDDDRERQTAGQVLVLALLREKYARLFDKTFIHIKDIKETLVVGIPIYRCAFLYILLFLLLVFGFTVHDYADAVNQGEYTSFVLLVGVINTVAIVTIVMLVLQIVKTTSSLVTKHLSNFLNSMLHVEGLLRLKAWFRPIPLPRRNDLIVLMIFAGPHIFSTKEAPNAIEWLKFFKIDWSKSLLNDLDSALNVVSIKQAVDYAGYWNDYVLAAALYAPFAVFIFYTIDISSKRRKILKSLTSLKGHLLYANILDSVINGLYRRCTNCGGSFPAVYERSGFDSSIRIVDERIRLELTKRLRVQATLASIMFLSFLVWSPTIFDFIKDHAPDPYTFRQMATQTGSHLPPKTEVVATED